jgi:hypothetical protein
MTGVIPGPLIYHGGPVQTSPRVYVDYWGWTSDPKGEKPYLEGFLSSMGATPWLATVNQYGGGPLANVLAGTWTDTTNPIPAHPSDTQVQQEAATAISHFGTGTSVNVEIMVATPTGHATPGLGPPAPQNCAYHGAVAGHPNVTYINLPYMSDFGTYCADPKGLGGPLAGVSIYAGHELAEAITDPLSNAWKDSGGHEIADKCQDAPYFDFSPTQGVTFRVQQLWSNATNACAEITGNGSSVSQTAFEGSNGDLWLAGHMRTGDQGLGMARGTSPTIAALSSSTYQAAFQANTGSLWITGALGTGDQHMAMWPGTSPAIIAVPGGYEVAFEGSNGDLWLAGTLGTGDQGFGMAHGTSPAITAVPGGYQAAFQANTGSLWTTGALGTGDQHMAMWPGTSPSITATSGGYEVATEGSNGHLWLAGNLATGDQGFGMVGGTSPAITAMPGGYQAAFQANTGNLWVVGTTSPGDLHVLMSPGASPSITVTSAGWQAAFQASNGDLWLATAGGAADQHLVVMSGTGPGITPAG